MYRTESRTANVSPGSHAASAPAHRPAARYRSRDFGTGYGSSSGYAAGRRYTSGSQPAARFRLV